MTFSGESRGTVYTTFDVDDIKDALSDGGEGDAAEVLNAVGEAIMGEWDIDTKEGNDACADELMMIAQSLDRDGSRLVQGLALALQRMPDQG